MNAKPRRLTVVVVFAFVFVCAVSMNLINVTSTMNFENMIFIDLFQRFDWEKRIEETLKREQELSLEQAYNGTTLHLQVERKLINRNCLPVRCLYCKGLKSVTSKKKSESKALFVQTLQMPCPVCAGTGWAPTHEPDCEMYYNDSENITASQPQ